MSQITYEASIYSRPVKYTNFKGETNETVLTFALDPIQLMQVIASIPVKKTKSRNPAKQNGNQEITDEQQIKLVRDLACKAAGFASEDGETWEVFENFENTIAGKAFLTKLVSSDADRKEFSERVILDPFRAFVSYAEADPSNSPAEVKQLRGYLSELEDLFQDKPTKEETFEEKRARLAADLAALEAAESTES